MRRLKNWTRNLRIEQKLLCFLVFIIITCLQISRSYAAFWQQLPESEFEFKEEIFLELLSYTNSIRENDPELARRIVNLVTILQEIDWDNQEIT
ncbi:MAG: hypothetical protein AB8G05_27145 [Oligoflexales bacterium]